MYSKKVIYIRGIVPTFQTSHFHRIYAAYGGIFIISSILWGLVDKKRPDRYEIIGSFVTILGAIIIFYSPTKCKIITMKCSDCFCDIKQYKVSLSPTI